MADHIRKEKRHHLPRWDEVKIIDREEHWKIRGFKGSNTYAGLQLTVVWTKYREKYDLGTINQKGSMKKNAI